MTTIVRQWLRDGEPIEGATGETYTLTTDDLGKTITYQETATSQLGPTNTVISNPVGPILAAPPT
jgi:serine protease